MIGIVTTMTAITKLRLIKILHTLIWIGYNCLIFYMLYLVVTDQLTLMLWIGYILVAIEAGVLWYFKFTCPLTIIARRYSNSERANFDIFLPEWLARHTKVIYTTIMGLIICMTILQLLK